MRGRDDLIGQGMMFMQKMGAGHLPMENVPTPEQAQETDLNEDQIKEMLKAFPKYQLKMAKALPEETIAQLIQQRSPVKLTPDTITRIVSIVKA